MGKNEMASLRESLAESHKNLLFTDSPAIPTFPSDEKAPAVPLTTDGSESWPAAVLPTPDPYGYSRLDSSEPDNGTAAEDPPTDGYASPVIESRYITVVPKPYDLTIGIELEAIINNLSDEDSLNVHKLVADVLRPLAHEIDTTVVHQQGNSLPDVPYSEDVFHVVDDLSILTTIELDLDNISSIPKKGMTAAGVEIITPILRDGEWISVIPKMMKIIEGSFDVSFNHTTGLHVHVGIGRPYTLRDLKRIGKVIVLFEDALNEFHPVYRSPRYTLQGSHILPCRKGKHLIGLSDHEMMLVLEKTTTIPEFLSKINPIPHFMPSPGTLKYWKGYRYSFASVLTLGTIEFRQGAGTLDANRTKSWIGRISQLLISAVSTPDDALEKLARGGVGRTRDRFILDAFGVPVPTDDRFSMELDQVARTFSHAV